MLLILGVPVRVISEDHGPKAYFVGSEACKNCHALQFEGWKQTRMANVVRDPKLHPEIVLGNFSHPDPVRTFSLDDVAFVYGSRYKQRYFTKRGTTFLSPLNGISLRSVGYLTMWRPAPIGGSHTTGQQISIVPQAQPAMDVTR